MFDPSLIFQRTHTGREEIRQKQHGLTQSERLVLIMIDGVANLSEVRSKLPVLTDERFSRAIRTLQEKELIVEVFLPVEGQDADEIEKTVIDRFLQQDPLDPVTILLHDRDDEFDLALQPVAKPERRSTASAEREVARPRETAIEASYLQFADSFAEELKALPDEPHVPAEVPNHEPEPPPRVEPAEAVRPTVAMPENTPGLLLHVHWGYWLIAAGIAFIAGYFLARLTA